MEGIEFLTLEPPFRLTLTKVANISLQLSRYQVPFFAVGALETCKKLQDFNFYLCFCENLPSQRKLKVPVVSYISACTELPGDYLKKVHHYLKPRKTHRIK